MCIATRGSIRFPHEAALPRREAQRAVVCAPTLHTAGAHHARAPGPHRGRALPRHQQARGGGLGACSFPLSCQFGGRWASTTAALRDGMGRCSRLVDACLDLHPSPSRRQRPSRPSHPRRRRTCSPPPRPAPPARPAPQTPSLTQFPRLSLRGRAHVRAQEPAVAASVAPRGAPGLHRGARSLVVVVGVHHLGSAVRRRGEGVGEAGTGKTGGRSNWPSDLRVGGAMEREPGAQARGRWVGGPPGL